jgi:hypothetical protein
MSRRKVQQQQATRTRKTIFGLSPHGCIISSYNWLVNVKQG